MYASLSWKVAAPCLLMTLNGESHARTHADRGMKGLDMKSLFLILAAVSGVVSAQPKDGVLILLCKASIQGQLRTEIVAVDQAATTVNRQQAEITPTLMVWTSKKWDSIQGREVTYQHRLDRLSGAYTSYGVGVMYAGPGPTFICDKAPPAKF